MSYLEIYNESIRDLLSPSPRPLHLRENPALGYVRFFVVQHWSSKVYEVGGTFIADG